MNNYTGMRGGFVPILGLVGFIGAWLTALAQFILRHPLVLKMLIFSIFITLVGSAITYMITLVQPYINSNSVTALAAYFGVMQGIALYLTIILAGFGVKQVIAFLRSTG